MLLQLDFHITEKGGGFQIIIKRHDQGMINCYSILSMTEVEFVEYERFAEPALLIKQGMTLRLHVGTLVTNSRLPR